MIRTLKYTIILIIGSIAISCNKDDIADPYQPEVLSAIQKLEFISDNDSSIYFFDQNMSLTLGRDNNATGVTGYEWFTMQYSDSKQLTGAEYNVSKQIDGHRDGYTVTYSRDERNMLSKVTREDWSKTLSFVYDESYRLKQLTIKQSEYEERYTITYTDSNVTTVEKYLNKPTEAYFKTEYSGYDSHPNPFHFLVNVFYAPVFSSAYGVVRYDNIPLGMFLSANNPGKANEFRKEGESWIASGTSSYHYEYDEEGKYPVHISGGILDMDVEIN